jgi:alanyl-tRNA synthetase
MVDWKTLEKKWQTRWAEASAFETDPDREKPKYARHAGKLVQEIAKAMGGSGGGQQHFVQGGGGDAAKFKAAAPVIHKALEAQIH